MIVEAVVLSLIVGLLRKGKLKRLGLVDVKVIYLFFFGAMIQILLFRMADAGGTGFNLWIYNQFYWLHILSYVIITLPLVLNANYMGFRFMAIGTIFNLIPIMFNEGKMPVRVPVQYDPVFDLGHTLFVAETKMKFLSDIIFVGPPYPLPKVLSIGDLLLIVGVFWFIQSVMMDKNLDQKM